MRYDPNQAKQPGGNPGTYYFTISNAEESIAKSSGNEMIKLSVSADDGNGCPFTVYDYLVNSPGGLWKAKQFCAEVGLNFDAGELSVEQCIGKSGRVQLDYDKRDLEKVNRGEAEKAYLKVVRYGVHGESKPAANPAAQPAAATTNGSGGDDCPF